MITMVKKKWYYNENVNVSYIRLACSQVLMEVGFEIKVGKNINIDLK